LLLENGQDISLLDLHRPVKKNNASAKTGSYPKDYRVLFLSPLSPNAGCGFRMIAHPVAKSITSCRIGVVYKDRASTVSDKESFQNGHLK
jgi:hypothetical protein